MEPSKYRLSTSDTPDVWIAYLVIGFFVATIIGGLVAGCPRKKETTFHTVKVVEVERSNRFIGDWKTTVEFADGSRMRLNGKMGEVGESFQYKEVK